MILKLKSIFFVTVLFFGFGSVYSQFEPNPALQWFTIETEHFYVHFHNGTERTANAVAKICEESYGPITSLYNYEPKDKTSLIIDDESDYSNGATDYYGNRIEIAAVSLDFDLRGTHNWLRNVITHEFTHIVQIQSAMKFARQMPSIYLQLLDYENERRPDVLYGYPDIIVSYPISGIGVPAWYAEGVAQYQRQQTGYDNWDSHRDMILRMRTLGNNLVSWNDMGQFASVTTYKAESIYNQGLALIRYISEKYGENKLREISGNMSDILTFSTEGSFDKAIGKKGYELYDEWKNFIEKDYKNRIKDINTVKVEGEEIAKVGFGNFFPKFSPDGKKISYLSNKTSDYLGTTLFVHKLYGREEDEMIIPSFSGGYDWSKDGKKIIFSRRNRPTIHEVSVFDVYYFDLDKKTEHQLTFNKRAHSPAISHDGENICFLVNGDGSQNLWVADYTKENKLKDEKKLTDFTNGEQLFNPQWSPDDKSIIFDYAKHDGRNIARFDLTNDKFEILLGKDNVDCRTPSFSPDGKYLFLSSDRTGIYNVYRYDFSSDSLNMDDRISSLQQVTNVIGGAFMPSVDTSGNLTFASFHSEGYKINYLKKFAILDSLIKTNNANYRAPERVLEKYAMQNDSNSAEAKNKFNWEHLKNFNDDNPAKKPSTNYNNISTSLFFIPVLRFDNYSKNAKFWQIIKPGLYFYSEDVTHRMGIFGGASINSRLERDLFAQFDYNNGVPFLKDFFAKELSFIPHFSLQGYNISRKTNADILVGLDTIPVDITYDLLEFDFLMAFKIINSAHNLRLGLSISNYSSSFNTFLIPGTGLQVPATSTNYFKGRDLSLNYIYSNFKPYKNDDINPVGRYVNIKYDYEFNYLNPSFEIDQSGNLVEVFNSAKFHRLEADWLESFGLFGSHSIGFRFKGGAILSRTQQDNFFDFYATGLPGMKGYPFYALGGNRYFTANLTYRLPLVTGLDFRFLQFYFDKIYFSIYGDAGNAWGVDSPRLKDFKKDIGAELRIQAFSYFVYPTSFAFNAAYGLDKFQRIFPSTTNGNQLITYGKEWRFYFTVLFGFDFLVDGMNKMRRNF